MSTRGWNYLSIYTNLHSRDLGPWFCRPGCPALARTPEDELREEEFIQVGYLSLRSEGPPLCWPLVVKAEVKPASLLRTEVLICKGDTGDESASIALDNAWSGAIQHLLSQRSGHNSGALDIPKVNRDVQPRRVFWRVNKAATE